MKLSRKRGLFCFPVHSAGGFVAYRPDPSKIRVEIAEIYYSPGEIAVLRFKNGDFTRGIAKNGDFNP